MRSILTYHSIDDSQSAISVSADAFRRHVAWLASGAVRVVPLDVLMTLPPTDHAVAITFDDGFSSFSELAAPLLAKHKLPATVFVVTEHVGGANTWGGACAPDIPTLPLMEWADLIRVREMGFEVGAHTKTHARLTELSGSALREEIDGSADRIERELGVRPTTFAYPYGTVNQSVADATGSFRFALTTELRTLGAREDARCLPRLDMYYFRSGPWLESYGSARFRQYLWVRSRARRVRAALATATE